jgi:hypothetical protein
MHIKRHGNGSDGGGPDGKQEFIGSDFEFALPLHSAGNGTGCALSRMGLADLDRGSADGAVQDDGHANLFSGGNKKAASA